MEHKKIIVTGGCGFLGQHLVRCIAELSGDIAVEVLDLKSDQGGPADCGGFANITVSVGTDICDYESVKRRFAGADTVIHLAGLVSFSLRAREDLERVNVAGTRNVLGAAYENNVKNFIHVSSVAALGYTDDRELPADEDFIFDWDIARRRNKFYMLTKHMADEAVKEYKEKGMNCVIVYPGLMFGPGDVTNSKKLISAIRASRIPFNMPGGTNIVDVRDVARGIAEILKRDVRNGDFLLPGHNLEFARINSVIAEELSVRPPGITLPRALNGLMYGLLLLVEMISAKSPELTADNVDSAFKFRYFSGEKAERELGWRPEYGFRQTINDTIRWMDGK
ncbi:MAG: NAD-dependent epimerase/dehydratase family protein [Elusimicrobia bacterium]|nr:NAD-dependent epimerase/dehydratase family protein [Elusimicrobiota bacterium]